MHSPSKIQFSAQPEAVAPLTIGPRNCNQLTGHPEATVRRIATDHGVPIHRIGRTWWIDAREFHAAVMRAGLVAEPPTPLHERSEAEQREAMIAELGLRVVGGGR